MDEQPTEHHDYRFLTGLMAGSVVGAALTLWLAPRAATEIKDRAVGSVKGLGSAAAEGYRGARVRVTDAVDTLTRKGQGVRDGVCDTMVQGAQSVEHVAQNVEHAAQDVEYAAQDVQRYATDAKTHKIS